MLPLALRSIDPTRVLTNVLRRLAISISLVSCYYYYTDMAYWENSDGRACLYDILESWHQAELSRPEFRLIAVPVMQSLSRRDVVRKNRYPAIYSWRLS